MNFDRSLQRLLRLRRSLERQEELKLAVASTRLQSARSGLDQARDASRHGHDALNQQLTEVDSVGGAELQAAALRHEIERERGRHMLAAVEAAQTAHREQCAALLARTREREVLDILREHDESARRSESVRREQAAHDEIFLLRRPGSSDH